MSLNYGTNPYLGQHGTIADALTYARANKWDINENGTGYFQNGQFFYHTGENQFYRAYNGNIWGDFYTTDVDCQQLNWTQSAGNGSVINDDGYVTLSCAAAASCVAVADRPQIYLSLPPFPFMAYLKVERRSAIAKYTDLGLAMFNTSDFTKNYFALWETDAIQNNIYTLVNDALVSSFALGAGSSQYSFHMGREVSLSTSNKSTFRGGYLTSVTDPPDNTTLVASAVSNEGISNSVWDLDRLAIYGKNYAAPDDPAFEYRVSQFRLLRL